MLNANDSSFYTYPDIIGPRVIAKSLCNSGGDLVPANAGNNIHWSLQTSAKAQAARDRQILEQLLAISGLAHSSVIAAKLLNDHGSLAAVLSANSEVTEGKAEFTVLALVQAALFEVARIRMTDRVNLTSAKDVIEYLIVAMAHLPVEEVRVLFLDTKNRLIRDEVVSRGTISEAPIYPREILKRAITLGASATILAHNHPSGDPEPSDHDILATRRLAAGGYEIGITLHDHIIIGRNGWISLREREQI